MNQLLLHAHAAYSWLMATFSDLGLVILIVGAFWFSVAMVVGVVRGSKQAWDRWSERRRIRRVQAAVDRLLREQGLQAAAGFSQPPRAPGLAKDRRHVL